MSTVDKVREFHKAMGLHIGVPLDNSSIDLIAFRTKLLDEEWKELNDEIDRIDDWLYTQSFRYDIQSIPTYMKKALLKEMADLKYVLDGLAVTYGLPLDEAFDRVHASNMSKLGDDGKPVYREDGKVMKGPNYHPPILDDLVGQ